MTEDQMLELGQAIASWIAMGVERYTHQERFERIVKMIRKHNRPWAERPVITEDSPGR